MTDVARDTIFALSSGALPAAIAVVRISGSRAGDALKALTGRVPEPRKAALGRVRDPVNGEIIDEALVLWFPGPNSETGEDTAELQLHGGRAVLAAVLAALGRCDGLRPAEAGEFTRRAFENGKLDLTAVEGLADLVAAETEGQRRQAFRQMKGALGAKADDWRHRLIQALALVEAQIDFSDEADVPDNLIGPALDIVRELVAEIEKVLDDGRKGERLRDGLVVAIAGPPNAGKSTLLNRIAKREVAIVSPYAGTTRDVIEVHLDLDGWPVTLLDTAGIRETSDPVEMEGVRRAKERTAAADLILWVEDVAAGSDDVAQHGLEPGAAWDVQTPDFAGSVPVAWRVRNKADLLVGATANLPPSGTGDAAKLQLTTDTLNSKDKNESILDRFEGGAYSESLVNGENPARSNRNELISHKIGGLVGSHNRNDSVSHDYDYQFIISAVTGHGLQALLSALEAAARRNFGGDPPLIVRQRQRHAVEQARAALNRCLSPSLHGRDDVIAEELRLAADALARVTGRIDVEDVLDVIFRDFCIGK